MNDADPTNSRPDVDVLADAIRILTEAARRTTTIDTGTSDEASVPADFAEFLTLAVAATAANIGGIEALLAGRPGSWEANHVRNMLYSTVGHDEAHLLEHRTEPLTVPVHVANILVDLGYGALYDEADGELQLREDDIDWPADDSPTTEQDAELDRIDALSDRLDALWQQDCTAYGEAFRVNVLRAADALMPNLAVPVEVTIELDWQSHPDQSAFHTPADLLWSWALSETSLPGSGIALKDYPLDVRHGVTEIECAAGRHPLARLDNQ